MSSDDKAFKFACEQNFFKDMIFYPYIFFYDHPKTSCSNNIIPLLSPVQSIKDEISLIDIMKS